MDTNKALTLFDASPFMRRVFGDFDRYFGERGWPFRGAWPRGVGEFPWVPDLEVFERDKHLTVRLELPGLKKDEVSITATASALTIEGERKHEKEETHTDWHRSERSYGSFMRTVPLPEGVDLSQVKATFDSGVLEVSVPLPAAVTVPPQKVPIEGKAETKAVKTAA